MKTLRLWPGIAAAIVVLVARVVIAPFVPGAGLPGILLGMLGAALVLVWWLFLSRASWPEKLSVPLLVVVGAMLTQRLAHPSIGGASAGLLFILLLPATVPPFLVAGAVLSRRSSRNVRWATAAAAVLLGSGVWCLARSEGIQGNAGAQIAWRWSPTAEERLVAATSNTAPAATPPSVSPILWSGFRGAERDGAVGRVRINIDWQAATPTEVWRRRVGPGWSSFAAAGDLVFTHEQRGEHEVVAAYRLETGAPVWSHQDAVRFYEAAAGAGPRATPAVHEGRVYALGATGVLNALDAATGARIWSRDAEHDTRASRPDWGFAGSPLVVDDLLIVAASGRLAAYELASGTLRWTTETGGGGYSSPHLATVAGVRQILLQNGGGITGVGLDGKILWASHSEEGVAIVQPYVLTDGGLLGASAQAMRGFGMRRLAVSRAADGTWTVEERWTSRGLKPYFSDFVVHEGHVYGFDGTILSAINIETGERVWKGGRYGAGQMLLLPEQDLLLIVSEEGDLALVNASPDKYAEVAKFKAIEGKTWNHPVMVKDLLLVRNGEEMAAFRLR